VFCTKCGSLNPDGSAFCSTCGKPFPTPAGTAPSPAPGSPAPPAAVSPHWRPAPPTLYAGFWLRLVAYLVDKVILGVPIFVIAVLVFLGAGGMQVLREIRPNGEPSPQFVAFLLTTIGTTVLVALVGYWIYYAYFESSDWQATPGKRLLNLYVTNLEGKPLSFGHASGRFFARLITNLIPLGIGYILAGVTEKKQALHDMIAGCLVLRRY